MMRLMASIMPDQEIYSIDECFLRGFQDPKRTRDAAPAIPGRQRETHRTRHQQARRTQTPARKRAGMLDTRMPRPYVQPPAVKETLQTGREGSADRGSR